MTDRSRSTDKIVGDLLDAAAMAAEIVARGRVTWDADRLIRLAGEAVINRIGDAAGKLPAAVREALPDLPWDEIRANRVFVAHIYHRIDYAVLWSTLADDVPRLADALTRWQSEGP